MKKYGIILDPHFSNITPRSRKDDYEDSMLKKLDFIVELSKSNKWNAFIVAGDLFNVKNLSWEYLGKLTSRLNNFKCKKYCIPGNHDIFNERLDSLPRTPLGLFYETGVVENLTFAEGGLFTGLPYFRGMHKDIPKAPEKQGHKVLICHAFLGHQESSSTGSDWIFYPDLVNAGYSIVIAGHDHAPYPVQKHENGMMVFRPGSISRGTKHILNRTRQPQLLELSFSDDDTDFEYSYIEIPALKPEEIFSDLEIESSDIDKRIQEFSLILDQQYKTLRSHPCSHLCRSLQVA